MLFDDGTAVVDFGPTPAPHHYGKRKWLLWPVLAWRVAVPVVRWRGLNLFQHYVLALLAAGLRTANEIADRLDLNVQLVGRVLRELEQMGYAERGSRPSGLGLRYLRENEDLKPEVISGYVFRDGISGRLHQRFALNSLNYIPVASKEGIRGGAKVDRGSAGRYDTPYCTAVWPPKNDGGPRPTADEVRAACTGWLRQAQAFEPYSAATTSWSGVVQETLRGLGDGRVTVLSSEPEPLFVTTFAYFPEDLDSGTTWQVCDPFGLGVSSLLRGQIEERREAGDKTLDRVLTKLSDEANRVDGSELAATQRDRSADAARRVSKRLTGVKLPDEVRHVLESMEASAIACEKADDASKRHTLERESAALIRRAYRVAEELFSWLTRTWSGHDVSARVGAKAEGNAVDLAELATRLGYVDDEGAFARLFLVQWGAVKGVLEDGNVNVPAMAAVALLSTTDHSAHPLHLAVESLPNLFVLLYRMKRERDPVAHHGSAGVSDGAQKWVHEGVYSMCRALLPPASETASEVTQVPADSNAEDDGTWAIRRAQRLQNRAVREAEKIFGRAIRQHPARADLVEVLRRAEEIRLLAAEGEETTAVSIELLVAGGKLLEVMMLGLVAAAPRPGRIGTLSQDEVRDEACSTAQRIGFEWDESAEPLIKAKLRSVHRAAETGRGTTSALTTVALLACRDNDSHPLRAIARNHPDFLKVLAVLYEARGHGDRAVDPEASALFAADAVSLLKITFEQIA